MSEFGKCRRSAVVAVMVLATVFPSAGCGTASEREGSRTPGPADTSLPSKGHQDALTWEFAHIADFDGELTDVATLAEDDIWAVGFERNGAADPQLLHYDGKRWKREPLPGALGPTDYAPVIDEVGEDVLWMRPRTDRVGTGVNRWAQWDGTRWSAVPSPPPGKLGLLDAADPDNVWALADEQTALHWDGTRWTTTRLPYRASDLAVAGPDDVWAVGGRSTGPGTRLSDGEHYDQPASMHWDGTSWRPVETPLVRFADPVPPEPSAGLSQVFVLDGGEVRAYGINSFNHGEVEPEPADEAIRLRWTGSKWVDQESVLGRCARRTPVGQDDKGLFLDGNWYLTDDGRCLKIKRRRLPLSTGAGKGSHQSLWLTEIHRIPGTDDWLGAGKVEVNQSGDPFSAPVVVRLKRGG
ncbi:hypothetical protein [Streptomyces sp. PanSC9]|uniref:hypothetical protein n=1 Tax=Streptomyces sp. PanSC9 TaxID=1520461 RepID=UPI000FA7DE3B|nr:hypothetical protein [Streptomyces sp. PanSC9]ROP55840.1 hypothetical protein EDD94_5410 [Streptomyces sp. PanSC9]